MFRILVLVLTLTLSLSVAQQVVQGDPDPDVYIVNILIIRPMFDCPEEIAKKLLPTNMTFVNTEFKNAPVFFNSDTSIYSTKISVPVIWEGLDDYKTQYHSYLNFPVKYHSIPYLFRQMAILQLNESEPFITGFQLTDYEWTCTLISSGWKDEDFIEQTFRINHSSIIGSKYSQTP